MQYLRRKLREGVARIARENPALDFSISTPALDAAEARLNAAGMRWYQFKAPLSDVVSAFKGYEHALLEANGIGRAASDKQRKGEIIRG